MWIVVGLGNPGKKYERTRHNVGQDAVTEIARRHDATLKEGRDKSLVAEVTIREEKVLLAVPLTFMNESGQAVRGIVKRHNMKPDQFGTRLVIVHDELDLPPGTVRVKEGGGLAGHNGLRSITSHMGTQDYVRVRIGVGKPPNKEQGADHVLKKVPAAERQLLDVAVNVAADAVESILEIGIDAAMNKFNSL